LRESARQRRDESTAQGRGRCRRSIASATERRRTHAGAPMVAPITDDTPHEGPGVEPFGPARHQRPRVRPQARRVRAFVISLRKGGPFGVLTARLANLFGANVRLKSIATFREHVASDPNQSRGLPRTAGVGQGSSRQRSPGRQAGAISVISPRMWAPQGRVPLSVSGDHGRGRAPTLRGRKRPPTKNEKSAEVRRGNPVGAAPRAFHPRLAFFEPEETGRPRSTKLFSIPTACGPR